MADREAGTVIDRDRQTLASRRSMGQNATFSRREGKDSGSGGIGRAKESFTIGAVSGLSDLVKKNAFHFFTNLYK